MAEPNIRDTATELSIAINEAATPVPFFTVCPLAAL
jgi:hypothetical protein